MGIEQFIADDELTGELIKEGRDLVKREKNKRVKQVDSGANRERWAATTSRHHQVTVEPELLATSPPIAELQSPAEDANARLELLANSDAVDYSTTGSHWSSSRSSAGSKPQRGIFDDI